MKKNKKLAKNIFAVKRYGELMRLANWLQRIPNNLIPPPFRLIQIGSAFWQSRALYTAAKLNIADELGDEEKDITLIAHSLKLNQDHLYRLMRMLTSIGIFSETSPRIFKNSKLSDYLRKDNPKDVRAMIMMHNSPEMAMPWMNDCLESSITDGGIPFEKVNGRDLFDYMNHNQSFDQLFSQAMNSVENIAGTQFLDDLNWGNFERIIDVGGSQGSKSIAILKSYPKLTAVVYDRSQIINGAKEIWQSKINNTVLQRIKFIGGDLLESIPQAKSDKDAFFFMAVFHTFSDTECKLILKNLERAFGNYSPYVVIADSVVEESCINPIIASMDMQMLMGTKGKERSLSEWKNLVKETNFNIDQVIDTRSFVKYLILRRC